MNLVTGIGKHISPQTLTGRAIRLPLRLIPRNAVVPVLGGINRGRRWISGAAPTSACWIGTYEEDHFIALRQIVRPGMVAYDLGANAGYYTLALARLVGNSGRVYAFEPDARWGYFLRRHIELNAIANVTIVQAAVSSSTGLVSFDGWEITPQGQYIVPSISLDEFIAAGNPAPSFIKMDIEGAEATALKGARELLASVKPVWLVATHSEELRLFCRSLLAENAYRFASFDCVSDPGISADFIALAAAS